MKTRYAVLTALSSTFALALHPAQTHAQSRDETPELSRGLLRSLLGANWNLFGHVGPSTTGRFLLQRPAGAGTGEAQLKGDDGFSAGFGGGVDVLLRVGWRASYTYTASDLAFRTDNGDGSRNLDLDDVGQLGNHTVALEGIRYALPAESKFTPYASAGVLATWWVLEESSPQVVAPGGSTQYRWGAVAAFGLQFRFDEHAKARFEIASTSSRNPFTGRESFRSPDAVTLDEPTRVSGMQYRLVGVYNFGKPKAPQVARRSRAH
jgi:hypothetical protein